MTTMKKKHMLLVMGLLIASETFAQQIPDMRSNINTVFNNIIIPLLIFGVVSGVGRGVWMNWDAILGKNGANKQDGWFAVGEQVLYALAFVAVISAVAALASTMSFQI